MYLGRGWGYIVGEFLFVCDLILGYEWFLSF